jgi:spore germination protein GerM
VTERRIAAATLALLAAVGVASCGVGAQSTPHAIDASDVPFGLAGRAGTSTTAPGPSTHNFVVFFALDDRLRPVVRGTRVAPTPLDRLRQLTRGPTPAESDAGLRTLLPPDVTIDDVHVAHGIATIELSGVGSSQPSSRERALAVAQMVYTATSVAGVDRVRFEVAGEPAEVPRGDGTLTRRPVDRSDYELGPA